jgi:cholesterol transport system auxiliary component
MAATAAAWLKLSASVALCLALAGCSALRPTRTEAPSLFRLEPALGPAAETSAPVLILVPTPDAGPGLDGPRMAYVTRPYEVQFFARSEWVDTPARMLEPLLVNALQDSGRFEALTEGSGVLPSLRLDIEITALQQEFLERPSSTRFALRARLIDLDRRGLVATRDFEAVEPAPSDDPYGGVEAANRAAARVLRELAAWCASEAPGASASAD